MKGLIFINPFLVPKESVHQAERLKEEFNKLGVEVEVVSDGYLRVAAAGDNAFVNLISPDFAIYLDKDKYLSEILEKGGIRLFNKHEAVRVCDDKGETYIALIGQGVKFPKTVFGALCYNESLEVKRESAKSIGETLGYPVIVKESFGSMGNGVYKADTEDELFDIMKKIKTRPHLFQQYIGVKKGVDVRVIVIGGRAVAAMERVNQNDFRSNVARGGKGVKIKLPDKFKATAEKCAKVLGLDYCGVDLLYGDDGEPIVCEVNSNAFFNGIEEAAGVNVAKIYAEHIIATIKNNKV